jgi:hypothetical protein
MIPSGDTVSRFDWPRFILTFSMVILVLSALNPLSVSAALVWEEDFEVLYTEDLEDWMLQGYELIDNVYCKVDHGFTITNGALTAEDVYLQSWPYTGHGALTQVRRAIHNSSVAYGTWSFDWLESSSRNSFDSVEFIFTDLQCNYNLTGISPHPSMSGYTLVFNTVNDNQMLLEKYSGFTRAILVRCSFTPTKGVFYHIDITRDLTGQFNVYLDSQLMLNKTDNTITSSETFNFVSFQGNSTIDNIAASNSVDINPFETVLFGIGLGIVVVVLVLVLYLNRK